MDAEHPGGTVIAYPPGIKPGPQPDGTIIAPGQLGIGRPKGSRTKNSDALRVRAWVLKATELAGEHYFKTKGDQAATDYLKKQAIEQPKAFLSLLAKVLPSNIKADVSVKASLEQLITRSMEIRDREFGTFAEQDEEEDEE